MDLITMFDVLFYERVSCIDAQVLFEKGSVESTHKVPTSQNHTKHCHAAVVSLDGLTHR